MSRHHPRRVGLVARLILLGALVAPAVGRAEPEPTAPAPTPSAAEPTDLRGRIASKARELRSRLESGRRTLERAGRAKAKLDQVDGAALARAARSFGDVALAPEERRRLLADAAGAPLTDAAVGVARAIAELAPRGSFERAGKELKGLPEDRELRTQWWSTFVPRDLSATGRALDGLAEMAEKPEFRAQVDTALNVLRVAGRIEADTLSHIAGYVPADRLPTVRRALTDYGVAVAQTILRAAGSELGETDRVALGQVVKGLLGIAEAELQGAGGAGAREQAYAEALAGFTASAAQVRGRVGELRRLDSDGFRAMLAEVQASGRALQTTLAREVEATPEARQAARDLGKDLELSGRFAIGLARIVGAASNAEIPPAEKARVIKSAAEDMGPLFVKMIQTIVNQMGGLQALGIADNPVVVTALKELQDKVRPMAMADVRAQVIQALGKPPEEIFVDFDYTPFRSASIAQIHKAKIWVRRAPRFKRQLIEVAVKVQRPRLEQEFRDAIRASRLALGLVRESVRTFDLATKAKLDPAQLERGLRFIDNSLADFISSFKIETDFVHERREIETFDRLAGAEPDVVVPEVFKRWSGSTVITMEYIHGEKLEDLAVRYARAQAAQATPAPTGPLPAADAEVEVRRRATDYAARTYGLEPRAVDVAPAKDGFEVRLRFDSDAQPRADLAIRADGTIENAGPVPDLSRARLGELRDRLVGNFLVQILVYRFVHGDLHMGNFKILPDGKTVALLDFGQTVHLELRHFVAPALLAFGFVRKDPSLIARAIVGMSEQYKTLSRAERGAKMKQVAGQLKETLAKFSGRFSQDALLEIVTVNTAKADLTLSSTYLQWLKTSFSMLGNLRELKELATPLGVDTAKRAALRLGTTAALTGSPYAVVGRQLKRARVRRQLDAVRARP